METMCVCWRTHASPDGLRPASCPVKGLAQFALGLLEHGLAPLRQALAPAVDVEIQHGHRRLIRRALAALAGDGGPLERLRDLARTVRFEDPALEVQRIAALVDLGGPIATA